MVIEDELIFEGRRENLLPNYAFERTTRKLRLRVPSSLRSSVGGYAAR